MEKKEKKSRLAKSTLAALAIAVVTAGCSCYDTHVPGRVITHPAQPDGTDAFFCVLDYILFTPPPPPPPQPVVITPPPPPRHHRPLPPPPRHHRPSPPPPPSKPAHAGGYNPGYRPGPAPKHSAKPAPKKDNNKPASARDNRPVKTPVKK